MSASASRSVRCSLCGHEFEPAGLACHAECPLGLRCGLICCPSCGYQVVDESQSVVAHALKRLLPGHGSAPRTRGRGEADAKQVPLTHVPPGVVVAIHSLREMPRSRSARLSALGLVPGSAVLLVQRRPVPVIRMGETEVAVSEEILGQIWVSVVSSDGPRSAAWSSTPAPSTR